MATRLVAAMTTVEAGEELGPAVGLERLGGEVAERAADHERRQGHRRLAGVAPDLAEEQHGRGIPPAGRGACRAGRRARPAQRLQRRRRRKRWPGRR